MRAGRLDRTITFQRLTSAPDDFGTPVETWTEVATLRAEVVQASTSEFIRAGAVDETVIVFRIRYLAGISNADRVVHAGALFDVKEAKEIGRRRGLEIRCVRSG